MLASEAEQHEGDAWHGRLAECFAGLTSVASAGVASGSIVTSELGDVTVFDVRGSTQVVQRTFTSARRQPLELFKVCLQVIGRAIVEQNETQVALRPGELALYDVSRPYQIQLTGPWQCAVMTIPHGALGLPRRLVGEAMRRRHVVRSGAGRLLAAYLKDCPRALGDTRGIGFQRIGEAGVALLEGTLVADGSPVLGVDADHVRRGMVEYIRRNTSNPELSPASVAAVHHLSLRSAQRLFEQEETNLAGLIRGIRLAAVRRDLADPLLARYSIAAVAARSCIMNQQWLSRAFRTRFGSSPSEYRARALGERHGRGARS